MHLASTGRKTLSIDLDPQANLSRSLTDEECQGTHEALTGKVFVIPQIKENLYLLCGDIRMALLEKSLIAKKDAYTRMKELLDDGCFSAAETEVKTQ